jgi:hypothetical protein
VLRHGSGVGSRAPVLRASAPAASAPAPAAPQPSASPLLSQALSARVTPVSRLLRDDFALASFREYVSVAPDALPSMGAPARGAGVGAGAAAGGPVIERKEAEEDAGEEAGAGAEKGEGDDDEDEDEDDAEPLTREELLARVMSQCPVRMRGAAATDVDAID